LGDDAAALARIAFRFLASDRADQIKRLIHPEALVVLRVGTVLRGEKEVSS
jgi:hypothetical protein